MSKRGVEQFESQLPDHEILDRGKYLMTKTRREALVLPIGTVAIDSSNAVIWEGDSKTYGGISTTDSLNKIFPDNAGEYKYKFETDEVSGKLAVWEKNGEVWIVRNVFGSMITNKYIATEAMGGLQIAHDDGYNYHMIRMSPTGDGRSVVVGNYASNTFLASNGTVWMSWENGTWREDAYNSEVTTTVTDTHFSSHIKFDRAGVAYGRKAYLPEPLAEEKVLISYMATRTISGKMLHETIPYAEWAPTDDPSWLANHGGEYVTIPAGVTEFELPGSHSMPVAPNSVTGIVDAVYHWEFKEPITLVGIDNANLKSIQQWEEGELEQVASREWVQTEGGGSGNMWVTNVTGSGNIDTTRNDSPDEASVKSVKLEQKSVTVHVEWDRGSAYRGNALVNGVEVTNVTKIGGSYVGQAAISGDYDEITLTMGSSNVVIPLEVLEKPTVTALFVGAYPAGQTELKLGDNYDIAIAPSEDIVAIEVQNFGACSSQTQTSPALIISSTIRDSGDVAQDLTARVRVKNAAGTWSDYIETSNTVKCNNVRPVINWTRTYPGSQLALKDTEEALISHTATNADTVAINVDASLEKTPNGCKRKAGDYNTAQYTFTAQRFASAATTVTSVPVRIAHVDVNLSINSPVQVRSGLGAVLLPCEFTQDLLVPVVTPSVIALDSDLHSSTVLYEIVQVTNLAGKVANLGRAYYIKGFVQKTLTLSYPGEVAPIGTNVVTAGDVIVTGTINSTPAYEMFKTRVATPSDIAVVTEYAIVNNNSIVISSELAAFLNYNNENDITIRVEEV